MSNHIAADEATSKTSHRHPLLYLALGALGVVYGDIGTSPLYAFRESFHGSHGIHAGVDNVLGILSLIWRERLFSMMSHNSRNATDFFRLPPDRVVELGAHVEI